MTNALIIVDVQKDFCEGGSLAVEGGNDVAQKILDYLIAQGHYHDYVIITQDWHIDPGNHFSDSPDYAGSWPVHCVANTDGADLHEALRDVDAHARFWKGHFSAAYSGFEGFDEDGSPLESWLHDAKVTEVDIVGIATDYCVKATALDAARLGFKTTVILPLTAAVSPAGLASAIDEMNKAGVLV